MNKGDIINGYHVLHDFTTAGGGLSKWTFATKGGKEFFLKEFLAPTYPTDDSPGSAKTKTAKRKRCQAFEAHQNSVVAALKSKCAPGGNVIFAHDFFRDGTKYYKVTEKVDISSLKASDIARLSMESRVLIMKTVAHSLGVLHKCGIVHGDLKPDNLLIKRSAHGGDTYIAKLIDFDASFFAGKPPEVVEELVGDLVFYSPEAVRYIREEEGSRASDLGLACDIFALGIIYCLYLTGEMPIFDRETYQYPCIAANNGERICIKPGAVPARLEEIVNDMLYTDSGERPNTNQVFERLKSWDKTPVTTPSVTPVAPGGSLLKGRLMSKTGEAASPSTPSSVEAEKPRLKGKLLKPKS